MTHFFLRSLPLSLLLLCVGCVEPTVGESHDPVINGSSGAGFQEVVAVANLVGGGLCSGTVIGPYAVLTAKHCVYADRGDGIWEGISSSNLRVIVGTDVNTSSGIDRAVSVLEWRSTTGRYTDADLENGQDIAVILTREPFTDITPRQVRRASVSGGEAGKIVGFGRSNPSTDESGVKLQADTTVFGANSRLVEAGAAASGEGWTCQGDSGGPLFVGGRVVGVTSFGIGGCGGSSRHFFTAIPRHLEMIDAAVAYRPPCDATEEVCDGVDNDCDLEVDEVCTGIGEACTDGSECADERCEMVEGEGSICVRTCDPRSALPTCPFGFHCETTGCFDGRCVPGSEGWIADGDACTTDSECLGNRCSTIGGMQICARPCEVGGMPTCDEGTLCEDLGGGCGECTPVELSTSPRPYGSVCDSDDQCESGDCTEGEGAASGFCTRPCASGECGDGRHCREGRCVAGDLVGPGQDCVSTDDCALDGDCVEVDGGRLCAIACADGTCDSSFTCEETELGPRCVAEGLALGEECVENGECRTGICGGTCTRLCDESPCPEGFECRSAGMFNACFAPEDDGGCTTTAAGAGDAPFGAAAFLALFGLVWARRRRR